MKLLILISIIHSFKPRNDDFKKSALVTYSQCHHQQVVRYIGITQSLIKIESREIDAQSSFFQRYIVRNMFAQTYLVHEFMTVAFVCVRCIPNNNFINTMI